MIGSSAREPLILRIYWTRLMPFKVKLNKTVRLAKF